MPLSDQLVSILALVGVGLSAILLILTTVLFVRLRRLRRSYEAVVRPGEDTDLFKAIERQMQQLESLRSDITVATDDTEQLRDQLRATVSRVAVQRYDAFEDMGGGLSYSVALLDGNGDGVVLTTINGRTEARTYAKPVVARDSEFNLSPEETAAIESAMSSGPSARSDEPRWRRRRATAS